LTERTQAACGRVGVNGIRLRRKVRSHTASDRIGNRTRFPSSTAAPHRLLPQQSEGRTGLPHSRLGFCSHRAKATVEPGVRLSCLSFSHNLPSFVTRLRTVSIRHPGGTTAISR
jgi:hypothetical protein